MTYVLTIEPAAVALRSGALIESLELRRLRRVAAYGPRCPECAGPLVFGEGCQVCPVCGYSGCNGSG